MFLAQNVKKFLKQSIQESKTATTEQEHLFQAIRDIERGCGLDPDDTSSDPAFHTLMGNTWHGMFPGD